MSIKQIKPIKFFNNKLVSNCFDENFLAEKDKALQPIDFSEIEILEKNLEKEEKSREIQKTHSQKLTKSRHKKIKKYKNDKTNKINKKENEIMFNSRIVIVQDNKDIKEASDPLSKLIALALEDVDIDKIKNSCKTPKNRKLK